MAPDPILVEWRNRTIRVRHDDPQLRPYSPVESRLRAAMSLATDTEGLLRALETTVGERYEVRVAQDGLTVGLRRRSSAE